MWHRRYDSQQQTPTDQLLPAWESKSVPAEGFDPPTTGLKVPRSNQAELSRRLRTEDASSDVNTPRLRAQTSASLRGHGAQKVGGKRARRTNTFIIRGEVEHPARWVWVPSFRVRCFSAAAFGGVQVCAAKPVRRRLQYR